MADDLKKARELDARLQRELHEMERLARTHLTHTKAILAEVSRVTRRFCIERLPEALAALENMPPHFESDTEELITFLECRLQICCILTATLQQLGKEELKMLHAVRQIGSSEEF